MNNISFTRNANSNHRIRRKPLPFNHNIHPQNIWNVIDIPCWTG